MKPFILFALLLVNTIVFGQDYWSKIEGLYGATSSSLTSDTSENLYFACSDLFKSSNYGLNWTKINSPSSDLRGVFCNNGILFVNDLDYIYRSTNFGNNWEVCLMLDYYSLSNFVTNSRGDFFATTGGGFYRTTNAGINWVRFMEDLDVRSICFDVNDNIYIGALWDGLYRSTNNGNNWKKLAFNNTSIYSIVINSEQTIFVCAEGTIYKSTNNGDNWILSNSGLTIYQNTKLFVSRNDILFASNGYGVFKSTNNGISWFNSNNELGGQYVYKFKECKNGNIFAGSYGKGLFKTTNEGVNWSICNNGLNNTAINALFSFGNVLLAGVGNSGIYFSTDNGLNWSQSNLNSGGSGSDEIVITKDNYSKFYCSIDSKLYSSIDSGRSWSFISSPGLVLNLVFVENNNLFAGLYGGGLKKSTNGGFNWTSLSIGHTSILAKNNNGDLYSVYFNTLYRSTNNGENWIVMPELESHDNYSMGFDENNNIYLCNSYGVKFSTDNGQTWIPKLFLNYPGKLLIAPNNIYVIKEWGSTVYYSTNRGSNWYQVNSGLENTYTSCIARNTSGELFCGTENRGIYRANESIIPVSQISNTVPKDFRFFNNYPNPFNPVTNFRFEIPIESFITIKIFDMAGKEIYALKDQYYTPGYYEISWDGSDFASGIYLVKFFTDNYFNTQKIVLLK